MPGAERFNALWNRLCDAPARQVWAELHAAYSDPKRAYHGWPHVETMLAGLDGCRNLPEFADVRFDEVEAAIYFHDAIYDARAKDNEEKSADLFRRHAAACSLDPSQIERIARMIRATASHGWSDDLSTRLLLDLDLEVLGGASAGYHAYVARVRREYDFVDEEQWRTGRAEVLRRFVERSAIYQTRAFHSRLEVVARRNLSREIELLSG